MPQCPVRHERVRVETRLEPLRQHDLVDVAGGDVLLGDVYHALELLSRHVGAKVERAARTSRGFRKRAFQLALDEIDLRPRELIQRFEVVITRDLRVGDDENAVPHVVEREHGVEDHEAGFVFDVGGRLQLHRFEPGRRIVTEIPDRAAGETGQARHDRRVKTCHQLTEGVDERLVRFRRFPGAIDNRLATLRSQDKERILAEKRIAPDLLAAFDRFEQERMVGVFRDFEKRRHGCQKIGDDLLVDRHECAALVRAPGIHRTSLRAWADTSTSHRDAETQRPKQRLRFSPCLPSSRRAERRRLHHPRRRRLSGPPLELPFRLRHKHR